MSTDRNIAVVAMIGGADREAHSIVERELAGAGIPCFLEGSTVFAVQVSSEHLIRARQVLMASRALEGHWVEFPPGPTG